MERYLLFTLAAPMASFGAVAVGERRPTWDRPSKSQTLGLIAGCLGIPRVEEARHLALADGLGFAVRVDARGQLASDYHTAQSPKEASMRRRANTHRPVLTRSDELACDDLKTILSQREFIVGSQHTIALWRTGDTAPTLDEIAAALRTPVYAPFAGRKANPLSLPMAPHIVDAPTIEAAFAAFDADETEGVAAFKREMLLRPEGYRPIFADLSAVPLEERADRVGRHEQRRDLPKSRAKWRFGLRPEVLLKETPEAAR